MGSLWFSFLNFRHNSNVKWLTMITMSTILTCMVIGISFLAYGEVEVLQNPKIENRVVELIDDLETSGLVLKKLGILSIKRGSYRVVTPVDLDAFRKALVDTRMDSQNFFLEYDKTIHKREWANAIENSTLKDEIYQMLIHAVDQTRVQIEKVEATFENLAYTFQKSESTFGRNARGALDAIGDFFSWSFGLATTEQLENARMVSQETNVNLIKVLHANKELLSTVQMQHSQLGKVLEHQKTLQNATKFLLMKFQYQVFRNEQARKQSLRNYMRQHLNQFHTSNLVTINSLADEINSYFTELMQVSQGVVSPKLIEPKFLRKLIASIQSYLPKNLRIPSAKDEDSLYYYYHHMEPELLSVGNGKKVLVLNIPLLREKELFDLTLATTVEVPMLEHVNATATIDLRSNQIYASHKSREVGFYVKNMQIENCSRWGLNFVCPGEFLALAPISQIKCLRAFLRSDQEETMRCPRKVHLHSNTSQLVHLSGVTWAYSIRGTEQLSESCNPEDNFTNVVIHGLGRINLTEGCTFFLGKHSIHTPVLLKREWSGKLFKSTPLRVPQGFLASALPWQNVSLTHVQNVSMVALRNLKLKLANESTFQLAGTVLNEKTSELLKLTDDLIYKGELEAAKLPWFTAPDNNQLLLIGILTILLAVNIGTIVKLYIANKAKRDSLRDLQSILESLGRRSGLSTGRVAS